MNMHGFPISVILDILFQYLTRNINISNNKHLFMWPKLKKSKMIRFLAAVSTLFCQILRVPQIKLKKEIITGLDFTGKACNIVKLLYLEKYLS